MKLLIRQWVDSANTVEFPPRAGCYLPDKALTANCLGLPVARRVGNLPAVQEMRAQSRGQQGPLERAMATHSGIPACRVPRAEQSGGLQPTGSQS